MPRKVEISHRTIIFSVIFLLSLWLLYQIKDILLLLFVALILASALHPVVTWLQKYHLPKPASILLIYITIWTSVGLIVASIVPPLIDQSRNLVLLLPSTISRIDFLSDHQAEITQQLLNQVGTLPENILKFSVSIFGNLLSVLTTLVISYYLLLERNKLHSYLSTVLTDKIATDIMSTISLIESRLGDWVRGELLLMLSIALLTYLGLSLLGVETALSLAIIAGILEIIPNIGPIISAIPAILIALTINPLLALATACLYFIVQALENNLMVPKVMQSTVGVNPVISILALMIGFRLNGPLGAVIAIPVVLVVQTITQAYFASRSE